LEKEGKSDQLRIKIAEAVDLIAQRANIKNYWWKVELLPTPLSITGMAEVYSTEELDQECANGGSWIDDHHLTIKPGGYDWPPQWNFN
jgi:hypothetical protein